MLCELNSSEILIYIIAMTFLMASFVCCVYHVSLWLVVVFSTHIPISGRFSVVTPYLTGSPRRGPWAWFDQMSMMSEHYQGGHKPGILRDFSEHGKLGEFSGNSVQPRKNWNKRSSISLSSKYLCKTAVDWVNGIITISGSSDSVQ